MPFDIRYRRNAATKSTRQKRLQNRTPTVTISVMVDRYIQFEHFNGTQILRNRSFLNKSECQRYINGMISIACCVVF